MLRRTWVSLLLAAACAAQDVGATFTIRAERLYVGDGTVIAPAFVSVDGGKIVAVGRADGAPAAATPEVFVVENAVVTPGFVEGQSTIGLPRGEQENEEASEVTPGMRASSALDPTDEDFRRIRETGVTTLIVTPGNRNVIGGLAVAVKARDASAREMIVKDDVALHAVLGNEPASRNQSPRQGAQGMFARRPNSRMGVVFEVRRALQEGAERHAGLPRIKSPLSESDGLILERVARGDIPVAFIARAEQDITTALNIAEEFQVPRFYLQGAVEAYLARDLLARRKVPVLIGPLYHGALVPTGGGGRRGGGGPVPTITQRGGILGAPRLLREAGVSFALSQGDVDAGSTLLDYARAAARGGLKPGEAIAAISGWPADILGMNRVGVLAPGRDADLVLFSGDPFSPASRVVGVVIDGRIVFREPKAAPESRRSAP